MSKSEPIQVFNLQNEHVTFDVTNLGGRWINAAVRDIHGVSEDVLQGYETLEEYLNQPNHYGAICGRVANRIAGAQFTLNGEIYTLSENVPGASLHGGPGGFHSKTWKVLEHSDSMVTMEYTSPDGEEGYPGRLTARITYTLTGAQSLRLDLYASSDQPTPVNLAHHPFFNLNSHNAGHLRDHLFQINAQKYFPMDEHFTIEDKPAPVEDSIFDFRKPEKLFHHLNDPDPQIQLAGGYDHNFKLTGYDGKSLREVAKAWDERSGRYMILRTTLPGLQLYTCNNEDPNSGKEQARYPRWGSFCVEPQFFPNSPNVPTFPNTIVSPEKPMSESVVYEFGQSVEWPE